MLLLLCNKPLLFDLSLAASAFWGNALLTCCRIPGTGISGKCLFLSEFSKPKMVFELPSKNSLLKCCVHGGAGKTPDSGNSQWWHQLPSLCSSFASLPLVHPLLPLAPNPHFPLCLPTYNFILKINFLNLDKASVLCGLHIWQSLWHHGKTRQTLCGTKDTQLLCFECRCCNTIKEDDSGINEEETKRKGWFGCQVSKYSVGGLNLERML